MELEISDHKPVSARFQITCKSLVVLAALCKALFASALTKVAFFLAAVSDKGVVLLTALLEYLTSH